MINHIPKGKENAIKRSDLVVKSGIPDRHMREKIVELQKEGYPIVNTQDGCGYFLANNMDDFKRYMRQERKRALTRMNVLNQMVYNLKTEYFEVENGQES
jgi:hypothetical protein